MPAELSFTPQTFTGNARDARRYLPEQSVDLVVTSPPYWRKRDYGHPKQLGWENTPEEFASRLVSILDSWRPILKPSASVFVNLGDSTRSGKVVGVTTMFETRAIKRGWNLVSRILWAKRGGIPDPHNRLPRRHEWIFHLSLSEAPFMDTYAYSQEFDLCEGDVWHIESRPTRTPHLAPFPDELPRRAILLACPEQVCASCQRPVTRITRRGLKLNPERPQARRALELWHQHGLGDEHLAAIRATGICDAGKSLRFQVGANKNHPKTTQLALEAKSVLRGYFREFTFAIPEHDGWAPCPCGCTKHQPGFVLDPFMGSGTTLRVAEALGRFSAGIDLVPM